MNKINIAIDGPASSGKSTIARALATKLCYIYINTGLMYRAIALNAINLNIDWKNDEQGVIDSYKPGMITLLPDEKVLLNNKDVSTQVREDNVGMAASKVSSYIVIRDICVKTQQEIATKKGVVMDGRDITSNVLPNAEVKIFMWASAEVRAKRRVKQNAHLGFDANYESVLEKIKKRDYDDTNRAYAPLIQTADSVKIDTTNMTKEEVVKQILDIAKSK